MCASWAVPRGDGETLEARAADVKRAIHRSGRIDSPRRGHVHSPASVVRPHPPVHRRTPTRGGAFMSQPTRAVLAAACLAIATVLLSISAAEAQAPKSGGTLRAALRAEVSTFDPP